MTEKELHKLRRQDLLQLLLLQSREVAQQKAAIEELTESLNREKTLTDRLRGELDDRDANMNSLKEEAEKLRTETESMRARLEDKDLALDIARARLDQLAMSMPERADGDEMRLDSGAAEEKEARLQYLRSLLEKNREAAERLRRGSV